jgi:hypothetical protein
MAVREVKHNRGEELNAEYLRAALGNRPLPHRFLLTRPYFSKGCFAQTPVWQPPSITATGGLGHHPSLAIKKKIGSQSVGFDYLAPIDETML